MDTFLTIVSTKEELATTSFLSSLDMDPGQGTTSLASPGGSRVNLAMGGDGILASLASPPPAGNMGGADTPPRSEQAQAPSKFSDFRRFVSFAVRRDSMQPS